MFCEMFSASVNDFKNKYNLFTDRNSEKFNF